MDSKQRRRDGKAPSDMVNLLVDVREWLSIAMQDPGVHIFSGDALGKIYSHLIETFNIDSLQELVERKMAQLDKLYSDILELGWVDSRDGH